MAATLPACSGVFFRLHCRHQQLFENEYKRSNRNRGTKILRCFPHCCPSHVERSYCGSSLELAVEMHTPTVLVDAQTLFVFARFETVDLESSMVVGQHCSLRYLQSMSQSEANSDAPWIQAVMQNRAQASANGSTTRVFLLNGQTSSKWYYHWESGANKARRLTKHVLKAYILYRRPRAENADLVQVISTVSSPPFTLVSYRRAAWEGLDGVDPGATYGADSEGIDLHQIVQNQISNAFHDYQKQPDHKGKVVGQPPVYQHQNGTAHPHGQPRDSFDEEDRFVAEDDDESMHDCENCAHYRRLRPSAVVPVLRDQWSWERQHTAMLQHMKDLAIIFHFISHVPMSAAMQSFRVREHVYASLQHHWGAAVDGPRHPATILSLLFPSRDATTAPPSSSSATSLAMNSQMENLFVAASKLCVWMLSSENISLYREFFDGHTAVLLNKRRLREAFLHFAGLLCKRIHSFWLREVAPPADGAPRDSPFKALRTLSEHVIALSHQQPRFQIMWPDLREILETPGPIMWESFVAQMRETFVRKASPLVSTPTDGLGIGFAGCWTLDAASVSVDRPALGSVPANKPRELVTPSISVVFAAMAQLQQVWIQNPHTSALLLRSEISVLPDEHPWMTLMCDGTPRTCSSLPMGISSLVGSELFGGDYIAAIHHKRGRVHLETYWWPFRMAKWGRSCHAVRVLWTLQLHPVAPDSSGPTALLVSMDMQHGAIIGKDTERDRGTRLELWPPSERLALNVAWAPVWRVQARYERTTAHE